MSHVSRRNCVTCGQHDSRVGPISWGGNCQSCGQRNMTDNIIGIATKQGIAHRRWLRGMEKFVERARLDVTRYTP